MNKSTQNSNEDLVHNVLSVLEQKLSLLLAGSHFTEVVVPDKYKLLKGQHTFEAFELWTRRFTHPKLQHVTFASLQENGKRRAITVYALPLSNQSLPIFGMDYVGFGGFLTLAALDLAPTDPEFWNHYAKPVLEACHQGKQNCIERKLPENMQKVFSNQALVLAAKDLAACENAIDFAIETMKHYCQWLDEQTEIALSIKHSESLEKWCLAMQQNKKESGALSRLFGF